jgi:hypothetical protein
MANDQTESANEQHRTWIHLSGGKLGYKPTDQTGVDSNERLPDLTDAKPALLFQPTKVRRNPAAGRFSSQNDRFSLGVQRENKAETARPT